MSPRLMHVSDLHFGAVAHSWKDETHGGIESAILSTARCWMHLCQTAVDRKVDAFITAGDQFHVASPDPDSLALFAEGLRLLGHHGIPVLIVAGNHDRASSPGRHSIIESFASAVVPFGAKVLVSTRPEMVDVGPFKVATLPSVSRHQFMAGNLGIGVIGADAALIDGLKAILQGFAAEGADILTGHWSVAGSMLGGEADIALIAEEMLSPLDTSGPWTYQAWGHVHRAQLLDHFSTWWQENTPSPHRIAGGYSGCIDRANFGEENYTPGAWLIDMGAGPQAEFIPTPARLFKTIRVTDDGSDYTGTEYDSAGLIVRVLGCPENEVNDWRRVLESEGAALVRIQTKRERHEVVRAAGAAEAPGPLAALDIFLEHKSIEDALRTRVRARAEELVGGPA